MHAPVARLDAAPAATEFVTFRLADQWLGIPVLLVQEVLSSQRLAKVPVAPEAVAGFLNLRGQIVTALDLRVTLELPPRSSDASQMNVVVQHDGELFAFIVDDVGDVVTVAPTDVEPPPTTLDARWRSVAHGIIRREAGLLVVVRVGALLAVEQPGPG